ncbi:hypothetical protein [Metabacillus fastidiosus]|uniref:hypothetical protein n=1 Tax=Metabacillus fastidiosus TaxID=1458 RepID=UPI003D2C21D4
MQVQYKDEIIGSFNFKEGDYITIVLRYLTMQEGEEELYYHGTIKKIEDSNGIWCILDNKTEEEYFAFNDIESVFSGDRIPFFAGSIERPNFNKEELQTKPKLEVELDEQLIVKLQGIAMLQGVTLERVAALVLEKYIGVYSDKIAADKALGK